MSQVAGMASISHISVPTLFTFVIVLRISTEAVNYKLRQ